MFECWFIADLLYRDYQSDQKFTLTTYTANGVVCLFHVEFEMEYFNLIDWEMVSSCHAAFRLDC